MILEVVVQDNVTGQAYDISELILEASLETTMSGQPGKLSFTYINDNVAQINEGSPLSFKADGANLFYGYVFKRNKTQDGKVVVLAYDQMRYLKNKDTYVLSGLTASQIFSKICNDYKLKASVISPSSYVVAPKIHDNKTLFEVIQSAVDETLTSSGTWYTLRDNFGTIEFVNVNALKTLVFIGDGSSLLGYNYETSIDSDTYNQVKLIKENKDTKKREVYIIKDSAAIAKWGQLQYFDKMDEKANEAQIRTRAAQILKLKNRLTKSLKLECLGRTEVSAGSGVILGINDLFGEAVAANQYYMVTNCIHKFSNGIHTMNLEVVVSI